jgi:hypothetical protein
MINIVSGRPFNITTGGTTTWIRFYGPAAFGILGEPGSVATRFGIFNLTPGLVI